MLRRIVVILFILVLSFFIVIVHGNRQMKQQMLDDQKELAMLANSHPAILLSLNSIPEPVQCYMHWVMKDTIEPILLVHLQHTAYYGFIERKDGRYTTNWKYLVAEQWTAPHNDGFVWNAMMHLRWDFWTKCRYRMMHGRAEKIWKWMGILKYQYDPKSTLERNAMIHYIAGSMWAPTQLISNRGLILSARNDTTVHVVHYSEKDTVAGDFIFEPDGRPKWFITEDYLFDPGEGVRRVPWRVKYWQYFERSHYQLPSRMSASIRLDGQWQDLYDFRLDLLECLY